MVAVFQAYVRAQSILLDYSQVGKGHEVLLDPAVGDHEKSPHTSLGEEKKSPFSSLGDVVCVAFSALRKIMYSTFTPTENGCC